VTHQREDQGDHVRGSPQPVEGRALSGRKGVATGRASIALRRLAMHPNVLLAPLPSRRALGVVAELRVRVHPREMSSWRVACPLGLARIAVTSQVGQDDGEPFREAARHLMPDNMCLRITLFTLCRFVLNPFADILGAIRALDTFRCATRKTLHCVAVYERHLFQLQSGPVITRFALQQFWSLGQCCRVNSSAQGQDTEFSLRRSLNLQHWYWCSAQSEALQTEDQS
jgi:hypothetical protein